MLNKTQTSELEYTIALKTHPLQKRTLRSIWGGGRLNKACQTFTKLNKHKYEHCPQALIKDKYQLRVVNIGWGSHVWEFQPSIR